MAVIDFIRKVVRVPAFVWECRSREFLTCQKFEANALCSHRIGDAMHEGLALRSG